MSNIAIVLVICKDKKEAGKIGLKIVSEKLAACVNVLDVKESIFVWKNKLCREKEVLMMIKTTVRNLKRLEARIKDLHSYSCPEIVITSVKSANRDYLKWVISSCR